MSGTAAVSVVMPVRDGEATLASAIGSVLHQTHGDWELIVINDGSTDGTPELLEVLGGDPRLKVIATPPQGIAKALQIGCAAAQGEWIARMDADDVMHPQRLQAQLEHAAMHPELGVVSCLVEFGGDAAGYCAHVDWINGLRSPQDIALRRFIEAPVAHPSVMFRRELMDRFGGYRDGDFPEDYELWLRWLDAGVRFGKVERSLLQWNDLPSRLSRTDPRYDVSRFYRIKCRWLARWLRVEVDAGRELWLWGAGRVTRRRFEWLEAEGVAIAGFIDIDPNKVGGQRDGRPVRLHDDLPPLQQAFIIVGVGNRGARQGIHDHLTSLGHVEGRDFVFAA